MTWLRQAVIVSLKGLTRLICRVDDSQLERVPPRGPLILVSNHVNFLEVPLVFTHLQPRPVTGLAKAETWDNPLLGPLFNLWGAIPVQRGAVDRAALRRALAELEAGRILAIAPEGTRSGNGRLGRGRAGVAALALLSGAPLLPLAFYGGELLRPNLARLRRTEFRIVVGHPFHLVSPDGRAGRALRQQMTDEIMYQLAALLPPEYRGAYADLETATEEHLRFLPGARSNLPAHQAALA